MDLVVGLYLTLAVGAAAGWFVAALMAGSKIQRLEDENLDLKRLNNTLQEQIDSTKVSNRKRVQK